jgi:quercetin dioxygenase-like cupin family protein
MRRLCNFALRFGNLAAAERGSRVIAFVSQSPGSRFTMLQYSSQRRSILTALAGFGLIQSLLSETDTAHAATPEGFVLGPAGGEHLIHFRDGGNIFIKADPVSGSGNLAMGTQQLPKGSGIPVHRHPHLEEVFYVLEGSGTVTLNDVRHSCERGGTIFIPKNTWHGFSSPDQELVLLWIMAPPGLDGFFRETCSPPGEPRKELSREQINAIALKYGTEFR